MKVCCRCKVPKLLESFSRNKRRKDGRNTMCRRCMKVYREENREKISQYMQEYGAAYYQQHKDAVCDRSKRRYDANKETIQVQHRSWRAGNIARARAVQRAYNEANKEQLSDYKRQWHQSNPHKSREYSATRRARKRSAFVEPVLFDAVFERDAGHCHICHEPVQPTQAELDHVIPLAKGGEHSYANVKLSHASCNRKKHVALIA